MDVARFSRHYHVRHLTDQDVPEIYRLCSRNTLFYQHCPPFVSEQSIIRDMKALPPRTKAGAKHYVGYYDGETLIAVMDLIAGYPDKSTAFIGFFMVEASLQGTGIGSGIIGGLCAFLREAQFTAVRLGWVKGNPQAASFWHRNGFTETGVTYHTDNYTVTVAERVL